MKPKTPPKSQQVFLWFGAVLAIAGFIIMARCSMSGRLDSIGATTMAAGFTTSCVGTLLLTRNKIAVFFLFLYALAMMGVALSGPGWRSVMFFVSVALLLLCRPLFRRARD